MADPLGIAGGMGSVGGAGGLQPVRPGPVSGPQGAPTASFKDVLMKNLEQVNRLQQDAARAIEDLYSGRRDDVDGVFIAKQKADLAFQLLLEVRNKLIDAYEEIKQIRV